MNNDATEQSHPFPTGLKEQAITTDVVREKYAKGDETCADDIRRRVAKALSYPETDQAKFAEIFLRTMQSGFIPAGRINSAAGTNLQATLINCFVQPVGDHTRGIENGVPGIFDAVTESAETMRRGGGVGYDFSSIRPRGAKVKGTGSSASGPVSYMHVFDRMCTTVSSAGSRRGAQMGVLRIDHPDIEEFIVAKSEAGALTQFNVSVAVTDLFMTAMADDQPFELVHAAEPTEEFCAEHRAYQRDDGLWVYKVIDPKALWDQIMRNTYDWAEPGILFVDNANRDNNLWYAEKFSATNPCAEQWLPPYGCCCLGSINLTKFISDPFSENASFDFASFDEVIRPAIRMLDNTLDVTYWPLEQQREEAMSKRRVGLGFTGLGDALLMMGIRYDSYDARRFAARVSKAMMISAYNASVDLAETFGAFPLFDADKYLDSAFAKRLPDDLRDRIRKHGIRNSHLISIAPTGTISLAFADNASNGIEPAFSWYYERRKRNDDDTYSTYFVIDHAFRRFCIESLGVDPIDSSKDELDAIAAKLPDYFVSALSISAQSHLKMVAAVQPYVDSSISKTVNVPADYPYDEFKDLYTTASNECLKGLATYRPSEVRGAVLSAEPSESSGASAPALSLEQSDIDRRLTLETLPEPVMKSLRWPKRPKLPAGNPSMTYMVDTGDSKFGVFVGYTQNGVNHPFEVWVNGSTQPRGLGPIAKALSMDMRSNDRAFLMAKLDFLEQTIGDDGFDFELPPTGQTVRVPSLVSGFAKLLKYSISSLEANPPANASDVGTTDLIGDAKTPMMDALISHKEPKTGPDGTMSWSVDVQNHTTGDDFVLVVRELVMPDGERRPFSVRFAGEYPRVFDGLCKVLSFDMRIVDPAWIAAKLRSLSDYAEAMGDFFASVPGKEKQTTYPSTVAYVAQLLLHRYAMLGILDDEGFPVKEAGLMEESYDNVVNLRAAEPTQVHGAYCESCKTMSRIRKDGCEFCTACGEVGNCS